MEDLQSILEKINREGVEKADAEAKRIVDAARAEADALLRDARDAAAKEKADADRESAAAASRAEETIRQAARDVVLGVKESIDAILIGLLTKDVAAALADGSAAAEIAAAAVRELAGPGEITCGPKLAETLKAQAAALGSFTIVTDETAGGGFSVRTDGGRVEHAFTTEVIAAEIAKRLRPDLAKLLS